MFRAPLAESFFASPPPFVRQLMSPEALRRTGYFDVQTVRHDYALIASGQASKLNVFLKMGLSGVLATRLSTTSTSAAACAVAELSRCAAASGAADASPPRREPPRAPIGRSFN
jgi:hypothetical protein